MESPVVPASITDLSAWAQYYAALGWPVFPCSGKVPLIKGGHGHHDATTDPFQIATWWRQSPTANIGCPAGPWWWALDEDPRHGGDDTRRALEKQYGPLPRTVTSLTGGEDRGNHTLWLTPQIPFTAPSITLGPGLETRLPEKHYIILPPSIHPD